MVSLTESIGNKTKNRKNQANEFRMVVLPFWANSLVILMALLFTAKLL